MLNFANMYSFGICIKPGYRYYYNFRLDDSAIPHKIMGRYEPSLEKRVYFFAVQTDFEIRRWVVGGGDEDGVECGGYDLIGSEIYCLSMYESDGEDYMRNWMGYRMDAYGMPAHEIEDLVSYAFDYAKQCSVKDDARLVVPVVVSLTVCTLQTEKESVDEACDRAIRSECLIPLYLCVMHSGRQSLISDVVDPGLAGFFKELGMIRVEDVVEGLSIMEVCAVCLRSPTVGAQISQLPSCGHVFHSHCIVKWLIKSNSCPMCRSQVHDFPVCRDLPEDFHVVYAF